MSTTKKASDLVDGLFDGEISVLEFLHDAQVFTDHLTVDEIESMSDAVDRLVTEDVDDFWDLDPDDPGVSEYRDLVDDVYLSLDVAVRSGLAD